MTRVAARHYGTSDTPPRPYCRLRGVALLADSVDDVTCARCMAKLMGRAPRLNKTQQQIVQALRAAGRYEGQGARVVQAARVLMGQAWLHSYHVQIDSPRVRIELIGSAS